MTIRGIHHLTTITSDSPKIFDFFSGVLGLHLIKKTVNQDDVRTTCTLLMIWDQLERF